MTGILEADRFSNPDTQSVLPPEGLHKGVPQDRPPSITSGLPLPASVPNVMPDFHWLNWKQDMRSLVPSQNRNRVYLVTVIGEGHVDSDVCQLDDQLAAQHREHREYLQRVSTEGASPLITPTTAKKSWDIWLAVRKAVGKTIPIPSAGTGPDGVMFYSWDKGDHHLEAEIYPNRNTEFFYRNRRTGELWGENTGGTLPGELLNKLRLFV